jgi:broad specificity phosphatase PhoE
MDIFLVRHGEAAASWGQASDPGLSELGHEQARAAAEVLQPQLSINTQLISSPLARAQETAQPLAETLGKTIAIDRVYSEVPSPVPLEERQTWLRQFMQQGWDEQGADLQAWRDGAYQALVAQQTPVVVFTHFLVLNAVVGLILGRSETLHFYPDNGSVTHLRLSDGALELVELGREMQTIVN